MELDTQCGDCFEEMCCAQRSAPLLASVTGVQYSIRALLLVSRAHHPRTGTVK